MKTEYEIGVGDRFQIELASNPSTGHSWKWSNQNEVSIVEKVDFEFVAENPGLVGGGGKEIWKFKGARSGSDMLKFEYKRPWEQNPASESKAIKVKVK